MKHAGGDLGAPVSLFAGQVKLLYDNAPLAYLVTVINGAITVMVLSAATPMTALWAWYGCLLLVTAARAVMVRRYRRLRDPNPQFWCNWYVVGAAAAGAVWGSAAIVIFPPNSPAHQVFIAFVLAGMAAGAITVLAPRMDACIAFLLPALLPLALRYLSEPTMLTQAMGILTLVFLAGILVSAWNSYLVIRKTLCLASDKRQLTAEIEERHRFEEQLFQEKDRLQTTLGSIGEGVALIDADSRIEYMNPAAEQLCGWSCQQALHRPAAEVFASVDRQEQRVSTALEDSLRSAEQIRKQIVLHCKAGDAHIVDELATPLYDRHSRPVGAVSVFRDVTEAQKLTEALAFAADHDPLTRLPNRNLLKERTRQAIARSQRKHESFALLFLDLDRFKEVNDTLGHACGDALLLEIADRLRHCVREEDTIARMGGDEFVVLLDGPTGEQQARAVADKILQSLRSPCRFGERTVSVSVSIGIALYPADGRDAESLLKLADSAMYRAKRQGRDQVSS